MLLAVDIGNTHTVAGVFEGMTLKSSFRVSSVRPMTADEAGFSMTGLLERMDVAREKIDRVVIGSVVPSLTSVFESASTRYFRCSPVIVSAKIKLPIRIEIDLPNQVGADRIANSVAGFDKFGGPVIVVDFGTATTFDVVNSKGAYIGGVIIPGPETSMAELARRAARLFEVPFEQPSSVVGRSTTDALKSGLFFGTVGQVDYILDKILKETGFSDPSIVATGGLTNSIHKHSRYIRVVEPNLTLEGLRLISDYQLA